MCGRYLNLYILEYDDVVTFEKKKQNENAIAGQRFQLSSNPFSFIRYQRENKTYLRFQDRRSNLQKSSKEFTVAVADFIRQYGLITRWANDILTYILEYDDVVTFGKKTKWKRDRWSAIPAFVEHPQLLTISTKKQNLLAIIQDRRCTNLPKSSNKKFTVVAVAD